MKQERSYGLKRIGDELCYDPPTSSRQPVDQSVRHIFSGNLLKEALFSRENALRHGGRRGDPAATGEREYLRFWLCKQICTCRWRYGLVWLVVPFKKVNDVEYGRFSTNMTSLPLQI